MLSVGVTHETLDDSLGIVCRFCDHLSMVAGCYTYRSATACCGAPDTSSRPTLCMAARLLSLGGCSVRMDTWAVRATATRRRSLDSSALGQPWRQVDTGRWILAVTSYCIGPEETIGKTTTTERPAPKRFSARMLPPYKVAMRLLMESPKPDPD